MKIRNWEKFQLYKNKKEGAYLPWIKLYTDLLNDHEWFKLDGESAKCLVMLWLVGSKNDGQLPPLDKLSFRLRIPGDNLKSIIIKLSHWIENDSTQTVQESYSDSTQTMPKSKSKIKSKNKSKIREEEDIVSLPAEPTPPKALTDVQKVVLVYKQASGYPPEDKGWDQLNFARCSKTAKDLIAFFGNGKDAADCIQDVYERLTSKGLTVTIETVRKHAAEYKKDIQEKRRE
jgi:hypothetical protein